MTRSLCQKLHWGFVDSLARLLKEDVEAVRVSRVD